MDQIAYFEYFYAIFNNFDFITILNKDFFICYFYNKLKSSIQLQLNKKYYNLDYQDITIEKAIEVKVKANYQLSFFICKSDIYYFWGHYLLKKNES